MSQTFNFKEGELLLIDKPLTWTSFQVVNKIKYAIKRLEGKLKVGHAGTLDPLATGLLLVATGKMTKQLQHIQILDKEYTGICMLGKTTPSFDGETEVNAEFPTEHITEALILETAQSFLGAQTQLPPMHSAVQVDGKRLYTLARAGKEIELTPRPIHIYEFEITKIEMPQVHFRVKCSKGTYIRSLAKDFGAALHSGGYLYGLCRTKIGDYDLKNAFSLEGFLEEIKEEE
jgi:tRNA pseudouridine55 synthase